MNQSFPWHCPFCQHKTTINTDRYSITQHSFDLGNRYGQQVITTTVIGCPNPDCREYTLTVSVNDYEAPAQGGRYQPTVIRYRQQLIPAGEMRVFPDYVPAPILTDYREACLIRDLSPKASATLARRALQGMIRDFWGVQRSRLLGEIEALKDKVDPLTWNAIDAVRRIGNIGAHMERDIDLIVEVEPDEAKLLIGLIETLITEWYIAREERNRRMGLLIAAAESKDQERQGH